MLAIVLVGLAVMVELGTSTALGGDRAGARLQEQGAQLDPPVDVDPGDVEEPPGRAISYLALVDGVFLYTVGLMGLALVVPERLHGRMQGVATLIGSIVLVIVALVLAIIALIELFVMVSLFVAVPFGTIAYLALWGFFPRGQAEAVLALLMFLKLAACVALMFAQQRFLQQKGLVLLALTALVCNLLVAFLHGLVPVVVVSIVDTLAAIVIAVIAIIWGIVLLIGSIPSLVATIRTGRGGG